MSKILPPTEATFKLANNLLREGAIVGFPTETYYGLAVDPFNKEALKALFALKRRPAHFPVLVLVAGVEHCSMLMASPPGKVFKALAAAYWPGPLTLVTKAKSSLPTELTGGTGTIGMRQSPHPIAAKLVSVFSSPITATSANISGMPPAVDAHQTADYLRDSVELIIDGGRTPGRMGSTLIRCDLQPVTCIREGMIPFDSIPKKLLV